MAEENCPAGKALNHDASRLLLSDQLAAESDVEATVGSLPSRMKATWADPVGLDLLAVIGWDDHPGARLPGIDEIAQRFFRINFIGVAKVICGAVRIQEIP